MSQCSFSFPFNGTVEETKEKIIHGLEKNNGEISFSDLTGTFTINHPMAKISGKIELNESDISFEITDKPVFLPCEMIKSEVEKFFVK
ncbi:MAG: hypothetical protein GXO87_09165 [Chlorobi bacterium]|nr:hypothetical protein [Chlorobiota bacterium]